MIQLARMIDAMSEWLGRLVSWLTLGMVLMMTFNVVLRYALAEGVAWQQELVRFMHGIVFLAGASYALKHEALVRVDVLYHNFSEHTKAWVNIVGCFIFLFPVSFALIYFSHDYVLNSWAIYEGSAEYKGMPGVFLFKSFIWVAGATLILQGVSMVVHSINQLSDKEHTPHENEEVHG